LFNDIVAPFPVIAEFLLQNVRKEKKTKNGKKYKQLDKYNDPKLFTYGHAFETIIIKIEDPMKNILPQAVHHSL
jgi:hypothetical protein